MKPKSLALSCQNAESESHTKIRMTATTLEIISNSQLVNEETGKVPFSSESEEAHLLLPRS